LALHSLFFVSIAFPMGLLGSDPVFAAPRLSVCIIGRHGRKLPADAARRAISRCGAGWICARVSLRAPGEPSPQASSSGRRRPWRAPPRHVLTLAPHAARGFVSASGCQTRRGHRWRKRWSSPCVSASCLPEHAGDVVAQPRAVYGTYRTTRWSDIMAQISRETEIDPITWGSGMQRFQRVPSVRTRIQPVAGTT